MKSPAITGLTLLITALVFLGCQDEEPRPVRPQPPTDNPRGILEEMNRVLDTAARAADSLKAAAIREDELDGELFESLRDDINWCLQAKFNFMYAFGTPDYREMAFLHIYELMRKLDKSFSDAGNAAHGGGWSQKRFPGFPDWWKKDLKRIRDFLAGAHLEKSFWEQQWGRERLLEDEGKTRIFLDSLKALNDSILAWHKYADTAQAPDFEKIRQGMGRLAEFKYRIMGILPPVFALPFVSWYGDLWYLDVYLEVARDRVNRLPLDKDGFKQVGDWLREAKAVKDEMERRIPPP